MIPSSELQAMQAASTSAMDQTCVVQRKSPTAGGFGQPVDNFSTINTTVCSVAQPTGALMQNYAYLIGSLDSWLVRLPYGTDVKPDDQLVIDGVTMRVQVILDPLSYPIDVRLLASAIR